MYSRHASPYLTFNKHIDSSCDFLFLESVCSSDANIRHVWQHCFPHIYPMDHIISKLLALPDLEITIDQPALSFGSDFHIRFLISKEY